MKRILLVLVPMLSLAWPTPGAHAAACPLDAHKLARGVHLDIDASPERCVRLTADVADLGNRRVRAVVIVGDYAATLYAGARFTGSRTTFVQTATHLDRRVDSIIVRRGGCDGTPGVYVYADRHQHGRCSRFTADVTPLAHEYVLGNTASSIRIVGSWVATLHRATRFGVPGNTLVRDDGDLSDNGIGNDRLGSLRVRPRHQVCGTGVGVQLYAGARFASPCSRLTSTVRSLVPHLIGQDAASSLLVSPGYQATLFAGLGLAGPQSTFTAPDPDLADDTIGARTASSVAIAGPYPEQEPVRRVQVRIATADVSDAGTDDSVLVSLNQGNATWVDYGRDDFERGDTYTYDMLVDGIASVADLKWLTVSKTGSNGLCVARVELRLNGRGPSFTRSFSPCRWLDNADDDRRSVAVGFDGLREAPWATYTPPSLASQLVVTSDELDRRVAGIVGNAIHGTRAAWRELGSNAVQVSKGSDRAVHVVLKLFARVSLAPDPNVDVKFDLEPSCDAGTGGAGARVHLRLTHLDASVDFPGDAGLLGFLGGLIADQIEADVPPVDLSTGVPSCPSIVIGGDGAIVFFPAP